MRSIASFSFLILAAAAAAAPAAAAERVLSRDTLARMAALKVGETASVDAFPAGPGRTDRIRFERVEVYAPDAHLYVVDARGTTEVPRSTRLYFRGYSEDGATRIALSLEPDGRVAEGAGDGPEGGYALQASTLASGGSAVSAVPLQRQRPSGGRLDFRCGNENRDMSIAAGAPDFGARLRNALAPNAVTAHNLRFAVVGVDTDSAFMSKAFSNNTTSAANWIASMFNFMNTMYERDLLVQLQQGTTFYNTNAATDPFVTATHSPVDTFDLDIFGNYWRVNRAAVNRAFAILLSGQSACSASTCSASGLAWINQYCQKGFSQGADTVGSYSVNQVYSLVSTWDPNGSEAARLVGHELGHNFGAAHTHCTDATSGAYKVSTNTIDTCYSGEGGCYSGATSCPTAPAPGAPTGTIMSYCNLKNCGGNFNNNLQFHPTQVTALRTIINNVVTNTPTCLNNTDDIFVDQFE